MQELVQHWVRMTLCAETTFFQVLFLLFTKNTDMLSCNLKVVYNVRNQYNFHANERITGECYQKIVVVVR